MVHSLAAPIMFCKYKLGQPDCALRAGYGEVSTNPLQYHFAQGMIRARDARAPARNPRGLKNHRFMALRRTIAAPDSAANESQMGRGAKLLETTSLSSSPSPLPELEPELLPPPAGSDSIFSVISLLSAVRKVPTFQSPWD